MKLLKFLSTLPARGATDLQLSRGRVDDISIHAPREGSDLSPPEPCLSASYFYPRSPRGERRQPLLRCDAGDVISIHAPREGSDRSGYERRLLCQNFYPRSLRRERCAIVNGDSRKIQFLSTLPARGATQTVGIQGFGVQISIHAPREGSDRPRPEVGNDFLIFLSTLPTRGATAHPPS